MADPEHIPDERTDVPSGTPPPRPTWVKVFGIVLAVIVLVVVVMAIAGGGEHGPGRHSSPVQHDS